jgi:uncharacterized damage-inducible protein DinB
MKTVDFIRKGLERSASATLALIDDMQDAPLTFPTPKGGNHPLWALGHLAYSEGELLRIMLGRPNPLADWKERFGAGSEPKGDAKAYPSLAEVRKAFTDARAATLDILGSLTDDDLDRPSKECPPELTEFVGTYAGCFMVLVIHPMHHRGQVADARRAAGRKPLRM